MRDDHFEFCLWFWLSLVTRSDNPNTPKKRCYSYPQKWFSALTHQTKIRHIFHNRKQSIRTHSVYFSLITFPERTWNESHLELRFAKQCPTKFSVSVASVALTVALDQGAMIYPLRPPPREWTIQISLSQSSRGPPLTNKRKANVMSLPIEWSPRGIDVFSDDDWWNCWDTLCRGGYSIKVLGSVPNYF